MDGLKERLKEFWNLPISLKGFYYLLFLTLGNTIFYYIRPILNTVGISTATEHIFSLLWIIGIYFSLSLIFKSLRLIDIVAYLALISFYYLSPSIYPNTQFFVEKTFSTFAIDTLPFYFLALLIDFRRDKTALTIISKLQLVMTALFILLSLLRLINSSVSGEQMWLSYSILFPTMFLYYTYSTSKSRIDLILFFTGLLMIIMFGARGPLVCLLFYLIILSLYNFRHNTRLTINLFLIISILFLFLRPIMIVLFFITKILGLSTQIFEHYFEDAILNYEKSTGRNVIQENLWNSIINDKGGIGYGLGSDRIMGPGFYAHNLVYEVWMNFGLYIGSFLLVIFALFIIYTFRKAFGSEKFNLFLILLIWSVGHLMLSGTYLEDFQVYFFIGYCVNILRSQNDSAESEEEEIIVCIPENKS